MFKIECYCEDKNVPRVLLAVQGLVLVNVTVTPVVNAVAKGNGVHGVTDGTMQEMLREHLKRHKIKQVSVGNVKEFLRSIGKSPTSYSHCLSESLKAGWLKKTGKGTGTRYVVKS